MVQENCIKPLSVALKDNLKHTLPEAFYAGLAACSAKGIEYLNTVQAIKEAPYTPYLKYAGPAILLANTFSRLSEIKSHQNDQKIRVEAFEEALAQFALNAGVYAGATMLIASSPVSAFPVLGTFVLSEFLLSGDNAPVDYIRDGIASTLHVAHIGDVVDWVF